MSISTHHCTVRLSPDLRSGIDREAAQRGCSPSEIIRRSIEEYLLGQKLIGDSQLRHHRICEYSQAALDTIILEQHPEFRERIVAETDRRMERYHGAR